MENNTWENFGEKEVEEDALSFSNLNMQEDKDSPVLQSPRDNNSLADQDFFEFFKDDQKPEVFSVPDIIFCGKLMHEDKGDELNEYQKRDYLTMVRSHSFRTPSHDQYPFFNYERDSSNSRRSPVVNSNSHVRPVDYSGYRVQKVNITSLTSMSAKSRRRMFMFGPVKFKPEMELSAIKERQGRRSTITMFPSTAAVDGEKAVVSGDGKRCRQWNMVRSLRGRGHLTAVLARSFGCIPAASVGKWI